jgi:F-type H+-transporting ATPase subunit epsilon
VITLEIVTPERLVLSEPVDEAVIPGAEGYFGVLPGHAPLLTAIGTGELEYRKGAARRWLAVAGGFVEVLSDRISVMAENCEPAEEIDVARAREDKRRAEETLKDKDVSDRERERAEHRVRKAAARIQVAGRVRSE